MDEEEQTEETKKSFDNSFNLIYNTLDELIKTAEKEPKNEDYKVKLERTMYILNNLQNCKDQNCDGIINLIDAATKVKEGEVNIEALLNSIDEKIKEKEGGNRNKSSKNKKKKKKNKTKKRRRKQNSLAY